MSLNRISAALIVIVFILGLASGVSLSQIFQRQAGYLSVISVIFSWSGTGIGIYKLFSEYFKEQNRPKLGYSGIYSSGSNCFLRVSMVSGEGMAEGCVGNYTIENKMHDVPTVWEHSERRACDIGPPMGLLLFGVEGDHLLFPSAHGYQAYGSVKNTMPMNEFREREIVVNIYSRTGKRPTQPYVKKIREIIYECNL